MTGGHNLFAGGVARNACVRKVLDEHVRETVVVPEGPDMVGALGAALHAGTQKETLA